MWHRANMPDPSHGTGVGNQRCESPSSSPPRDKGVTMSPGTHGPWSEFSDPGIKAHISNSMWITGACITVLCLCAGRHTELQNSCKRGCSGDTKKTAQTAVALTSCLNLHRCVPQLVTSSMINTILKESSICEKSLVLLLGCITLLLSNWKTKSPEKHFLNWRINKIAGIFKCQSDFTQARCLWKKKRGRVTTHPAGVSLMKMLRIHFEDALEWTCCALLPGDSSQSSSPAWQGWQLGQMMRLNALLSPRAGSSILPLPGETQQWEGRDLQGWGNKEVSDCSWQISALEAALWGCTDAPCPRAGQGRCWGLLKQMCFVMGTVKTKKRKNCLVSQFQLEIPDMMEEGSDVWLL